MNLPRFIAQRIQKTNTTAFTSTVTKIGISSIAIGLAVMIISFSILIGFKQTIQEKLFSLSSHVQVSKITLNQSFEETPILINTNFYQNYRKNSEIRHVQAVANKAGLLKSSEEHAGIIIKGVGIDYDWGNFKENLIEIGEKNIIN
jgi:lipoprotein-releasing system permease protein